MLNLINNEEMQIKSQGVTTIHQPDWQTLMSDHTTVIQNVKPGAYEMPTGSQNGVPPPKEKND